MNRTHLMTGLGALALTSGLALTGALTDSASAVRLPPPYAHQPAQDVVIHCDHLGPLAGAGGYFAVGEPVVDVRGRGYVYFIVMTHHVELRGPGGRTYQLLGTGYDTVVRSTMDGHSPILRERASYRFDVVDGDGVAGRIRYAMHQGADGTIHTHDSGDCHLPKGDE